MEQQEAGTLLGHYRILEKVGSGGMGEVYRAEDLKLERQVAIKILPSWAAGDRTAVERLVREAKLASALNHPHIVTMYAIEEAESAPFLVMEFVEGETLRERVNRCPLDLPELIAVGSQVADALEAAHRVGLIHRDIKSTNILLTSEGQAKVVDFGLAKRMAPKQGAEDRTADSSLTALGAVVGTAAYMSPEQTRGETLDPRTDLFSLGVVLYEAATGRRPFEGPTVYSVLHEIALVEPPAPSRARAGLPRELDQVLLRAMAKDRERRYQSAADLASALRALGRERSETDDEVASESAFSETAQRIPNNLPASLTSFVGRQDEMAEVGRLLGTSRLITLTGAGGCGKSRLSVQLARNLLESYPDGAWLVELAPLSDPALVPQRIAAVLGVREEPGRPLPETLQNAIGQRTMLILLDNCEHLASACGILAGDLIAACFSVTILATSREALGIPGEVLWRVPPLHVPDLKSGDRLGRRDIGHFESVRLFVARAAAAVSSFALTEQNAETVAQICYRLDGIPLAIELAAARIKVLPVVQILGRLEDRFRLLTSGSPGALPHQQTLRATVDWSYELLSDKERALFNRMSVFAGGAALEAVESICSGDGFGEPEVLDLLTHLVDKSLVLPEEGAGGSARYRLLETLRAYGSEKLKESDPRYRLLPTLRAYGVEKLEETGAQPLILDRHAYFFLALAQEAEPELSGGDQSAWLGRLEQEHDNLRQAGEWFIQSARPEAALDLAGALWRFWRIHGHLSEGRRRLDAALSLGATKPELKGARAKALLGAGALARSQSDYERSRTLLEDALALARLAESQEVTAAILLELGNVADDQGKQTEARTFYEECLAVRRTAGDKRGMAVVLHNLGVVSHALGDYRAAHSLYTQSLEINRELGNDGWEALDLNALGSVAQDQDFHAAARHHHEAALAIHRRLGDRWGIAYSLHELGRAAIWLGDCARARDLLSEGLSIFQALGDRVGAVECLEYFATLAAAQADDERALILAGAAAALRDELGAPSTAPDRASIERCLAGPRERLGPDAAGRAEQTGRATPFERAIALATEAGGGTQTQR